MKMNKLLKSSVLLIILAATLFSGASYAVYGKVKKSVGATGSILDSACGFTYSKNKSDAENAKALEKSCEDKEIVLISLKDSPNFQASYNLVHAVCSDPVRSDDLNGEYYSCSL